jgi:hypothetical protein
VVGEVDRSEVGFGSGAQGAGGHCGLSVGVGALGNDGLWVEGMGIMGRMRLMGLMWIGGWIDW